MVLSGCLLAVHGGFTEWGTWSECSVVCGTGTRSRTRNCTNPEPFCGGDGCDGDTEDTEDCVGRDGPIGKSSTRQKLIPRVRHLCLLILTVHEAI